MKNLFENKRLLTQVVWILSGLLIVMTVAAWMTPVALVMALLIFLLIIGLLFRARHIFFNAPNGRYRIIQMNDSVKTDSGMNLRRKSKSDVPADDKKILSSGYAAGDDDNDLVSPGGTADEHARVVDDTQASILFNKTADSIIDLIHQTLGAHSTFFYLYNYEGPELILQCFRSRNPDFTRRSSLPVNPAGEQDHMAFFRQVAEERELKLISLSGETALPYYTQPSPVRTLMLTPLLRRGTLLGILGVDSTEPGAFTDFHVQLMHKYTGLLRHSIHSIDAVFVKNRLTRMSAAIKDFGEFIRGADNEDTILLRLKKVIDTVMTYGRFALWMYNHKNQTLVLMDSGSRTGEEPVALQQRHVLERFVIQTRRLLLIPSVPEHAFAHGLDRGLIAEQYLNTVLCIPIIDQDHCFGVLTMEMEEKNALDMHQVQFTESLCHIAALATARIYLDQSLASEITSDPLTGIDNQATFLKKIGAEIYRAKRFRTTFSLLLLEIDRLDKITEQYGNRFRHFILEKSAQIIRQSLRQVDIAARLEDDRLAIILIESPVAQTQECAFRIRKQIEMAPFAIDDILIPVRANTGVAQFGVQGDSIETMMQEAGLSLNQAKSAAAH